MNKAQKRLEEMQTLVDMYEYLIRQIADCEETEADYRERDQKEQEENPDTYGQQTRHYWLESAEREAEKAEVRKALAEKLYKMM